MKEVLITAAKPELETVSPNHPNLSIQVAWAQQKLQPESADVPYNRQQADGSEHSTLLIYRPIYTLASIHYLLWIKMLIVED